MTNRHTLLIDHEATRDTAMRWVKKVPLGWVIEFREEGRNDEQNRHMWAACEDVARSCDWFGRKLKKEQWRLIFLASIRPEVDIVPNEEKTGFIDISEKSTSSLTKSEFSDLIEVIYEYGARHGVEFRNPKDFE